MITQGLVWQHMTDLSYGHALHRDLGFVHLLRLRTGGTPNYYMYFARILVGEKASYVEIAQTRAELTETQVYNHMEEKLYSWCKYFGQAIPVRFSDFERP